MIPIKIPTVAAIMAVIINHNIVYAPRDLTSFKLSRLAKLATIVEKVRGTITNCNNFRKILPNGVIKSIIYCGKKCPAISPSTKLIKHLLNSNRSYWTVGKIFLANNLSANLIGSGKRSIFYNSCYKRFI
jgi:hypothetical protein